MKLLTASVALVVIFAALSVTQTEARPGEGKKTKYPLRLNCKKFKNKILLFPRNHRRSEEVLQLQEGEEAGRGGGQG